MSNYGISDSHICNWVTYTKGYYYKNTDSEDKTYYGPGIQDISRQLDWITNSSNAELRSQYPTLPECDGSLLMCRIGKISANAVQAHTNQNCFPYYDGPLVTGRNNNPGYFASPFTGYVEFGFNTEKKKDGGEQSQVIQQNPRVWVYVDRLQNGNGQWLSLNDASNDFLGGSIAPVYKIFQPSKGFNGTIPVDIHDKCFTTRTGSDNAVLDKNTTYYWYYKISLSSLAANGVKLEFAKKNGYLLTFLVSAESLGGKKYALDGSSNLSPVNDAMWLYQGYRGDYDVDGNSEFYAPQGQRAILGSSKVFVNSSCEAVYHNKPIKQNLSFFTQRQIQTKEHPTISSTMPSIYNKGDCIGLENEFKGFTRLYPVSDEELSKSNVYKIAHRRSNNVYRKLQPNSCCIQDNIFSSDIVPISTTPILSYREDLYKRIYLRTIQDTCIIVFKDFETDVKIFVGNNYIDLFSYFKEAVNYGESIMNKSGTNKVFGMKIQAGGASGAVNAGCGGGAGGGAGAYADIQFVDSTYGFYYLGVSDLKQDTSNIVADTNKSSQGRSGGGFELFCIAKTGILSDTDNILTIGNKISDAKSFVINVEGGHRTNTDPGYGLSPTDGGEGGRVRYAVGNDSSWSEFNPSGASSGLNNGIYEDRCFKVGSTNVLYVTNHANGGAGGRGGGGDLLGEGDNGGPGGWSGYTPYYGTNKVSGNANNNYNLIGVPNASYSVPIYSKASGGKGGNTNNNRIYGAGGGGGKSFLGLGGDGEYVYTGVSRATPYLGGGGGGNANDTGRWGYAQGGASGCIMVYK